jgi:hypothetical protein
MSKVLRSSVKLCMALTVIGGLGFGAHEASSAVLSSGDSLCYYSAGGCYDSGCATWCAPKIGTCVEVYASCWCDCHPPT